jgi:hypothetical protein
MTENVSFKNEIISLHERIKQMETEAVVMRRFQLNSRNLSSLFPSSSLLSSPLLSSALLSSALLFSTLLSLGHKCRN